MKYIQFRDTIKNKGLIIFSKDDIAPLFDLTREGLTSQLRRYKLKGYLRNPRRGVFYLTENPPDHYYLAYKIYNPSYISFESALSYYSIIPEVVYAITSATTKSTRTFLADGINFTYTKIKSPAFIGFIKKDHYLIAHPEKALVDYMYLVALGKKKMNDRLNISSLDREKVNRYTASFDHQLLNTRIWQLFKSSKNKQ
ncbi:hypothetical protein A3A93_04495 [Candidatus Roizmanbacteria bacterium RIFCSPLOWO2_01_FULL_38_12]|uniref:AbiEi antitoxin C-terminal domain-containing protein n=1 Tax=Candidatus Roizmanbacteria bacterium RIFCSPLOWO2_01_FULL_38_12 TaxID=1802061 RepID=A0A1F7IXD4_9BACT|nr:MAG: hypothetical protein A2861_01965 [Candidatus Roizmanbacteria bacterium RIFCSPHIGHO2_01_FULL_38_15]OGK35498.1 MAG: hypothetical protein A3F59_00995 [Candidatus Roizmanbacteria bacterium RIFCSPHIGHO2_12_FULL_38_13]OGK48028.1 MAG: hypothetical protein A3A93_04495 [Candidatus Roizmanbacteria bacterium RIFCSPLOWO2_01_FULL_38_12]